MCYELCAILSEYYNERITVRLFVSLIVAGFYSFNELFRLYVSFFIMLIIRSLRDKHGDGNENGKKAIGLDKRKTTTLHVHHAFLYISLLSLHDHNVKFPNFTFAEDGNKRQQFSFSFLELVKHLNCFGDNRRTKDARKIKFCSLKACCVTLFSYIISHNFPALKLE